MKENTTHFTDNIENHSNMTKVEKVVSDIGMVPSALTGILMSLVYSNCARFLSTKTTLNDFEDISPDQDIHENRMNRNEHFILRQEQMMQESADIMRWASSQIKGDMQIDAKELMIFFTADGPITTQEMEGDLKKAFMEAMELSEKAADRFIKTSKEDFEKRMAEQKKSVVTHKDALEKEIKYILETPVPEFEIGDRMALAIFNKIGDKLEKYIDKRIEWAAGARRKRRIAKFAAEKRVLEDIEEEVDTHIDYYEGAVDRAGYPVTDATAPH